MKKVFFAVSVIFISFFSSCKKEVTYDYQSTIPVELKILQQKANDMEKQAGYNPIDLAAMRYNISVGLKGHLETEIMKFETNYLNDHNEAMPVEAMSEFKKQIKFDSLMYVYQYDIDTYNELSK